MLQKAIMIGVGCMFVAAFIIFLYFILNPSESVPTQEFQDQTPVERPLTKEEFQAQEESQLRELLPENPEEIINTPEEVDAEVQRLQELLNQ